MAGSCTPKPVQQHSRCRGAQDQPQNQLQAKLVLAAAAHRWTRSVGTVGHGRSVERKFPGGRRWPATETLITLCGMPF